MKVSYIRVGRLIKAFRKLGRNALHDQFHQVRMFTSQSIVMRWFLFFYTMLDD
jgi:hypothetical protein